MIKISRWNSFGGLRTWLLNGNNLSEAFFTLQRFYPTVSYSPSRELSRLTYVNASRSRVDREREGGISCRAWIRTDQTRRMRVCMDVQVYTYAWAHKYASLVGRLTPTLLLLLRHPSCAHIRTRGTCPRVSIYEYGVYWRNMPNPVFTSPAYISLAGDSNHPLCIRISNRRGGGTTVRISRPRHQNPRFSPLPNVIQSNSFSLRVSFLFFSFFLRISIATNTTLSAFFVSAFSFWNDFLSNFSTSYFYYYTPRKMWRGYVNARSKSIFSNRFTRVRIRVYSSYIQAVKATNSPSVSTFSSEKGTEQTQSWRVQ